MIRYVQMVNRFLRTTKDTLCTSRHVEVMRIVAYSYLAYQLVGGTYSSIYICTTTFITVYSYHNILHVTIVGLSCPMSKQLRVQWPFSHEMVELSFLQFNGRCDHKIPFLNFHHSLAIYFSTESWLCIILKGIHSSMEIPTSHSHLNARCVQCTQGPEYIHHVIFTCRWANEV
jgi:hypothetical protein